MSIARIPEIQECIKMQDVIEHGFDNRITEMKELEERIHELNLKGIRVNEELSATLEILKNQIHTVTAK